MAKIEIRISGFYEDDFTEFHDYLIREDHEVVEDNGDDDDVFYYGLTEQMIQEAILNPSGSNIVDFKITGYSKRIELPVEKTVVLINYGNRAEPIEGSVTSDIESRELKLFILAQAQAGIDITTNEYMEALCAVLNL